MPLAEDRTGRAHCVGVHDFPRLGEVALLGSMLILLLLGGRLWGDAAEPAAPRDSRSPLAPGKQAPDFVTRDLHGQTVALQDYYGRPVVINFWATWCVPCRKEMPVLQTVYEAYQAAGLVVLAVSQDQQSQEGAVRSYYATLGLTFPLLLDPDGSVATRYNVFLLPSTVFVHPVGTITAVHFGPMTRAQIERYLAAIIPQQG